MIDEEFRANKTQLSSVTWICTFLSIVLLISPDGIPAIIHPTQLTRLTLINSLNTNQETDTLFEDLMKSSYKQ